MLNDILVNQKLKEEMEEGYITFAQIAREDAELFLQAQAEVVLGHECDLPQSER